MELNQLQTFLVLAREGHMTRAASRLHLTQPAVSVQLSKLEEDLGHSLFDRTSKGLVLTEAGETFLIYAEQALGQLDDGRTALEEIAGLKRGSLAIGGGATATTYLLPPLLASFHEHYPGIRFFVREQPSQSVVEDILQGRLDLGVVTLPINTPTGNPGAAKLQLEHWVDDELRLLIHASHRLAGGKEFYWQDLAGEALVLFEAGSAVRSLIDHRISEAAIEVNIVMELRSIESIKQMVAQGIGAAFVSQYALREGDKSLVCAQNPIRRQLAVMYRSDRTLSAAARAFLEMIH